MTPVERTIMSEIRSLRGHDDLVRNVLLYVQWNVNALRSQQNNTKGSRSFKQFCGIITETGETDKERIARITRGKFLNNEDIS